MSGNRLSLHYAAAPAQPLEASLAAWMPRLPDVKRAALERLREPADRIASVLGVALLGAALRARGHAFDPGDVEYPARGKPRLRGAPEFSIAHAHGLVACALAAHGRVGLDLEPRDAVRPDQLRLVLDPVERGAIASGALAPTDAWVMKEAVLKAAGQGVDAARRVVLRGRTALYDGATFALVRVELAATHVAWLAIDAPVSALQLAAQPFATDGAATAFVDLCSHDAAALLALPARG